MLVKEVMTSPAITITAGTSIKDALTLLDEHHVTSLPVIDSRGHLVGIVNEADLLRHAVRHDARAHMILDERVGENPSRIEDVMSQLSMTVTGDSDLSDAVELMNSTAIKSVPVVDYGRVVGVVSRSDVVHLLARSDKHIHREIQELLRSAGVQCEVSVDGGVARIEKFEDPAQWRVAEVIVGSVPGVISVQFPG